MKKGLNIAERIKHLEDVLCSIKVCTQPVENHTDPKSIQDCWNEVEETIAAIKSRVKKDIFDTWGKAMARGRSETYFNYEQWSANIGTNEFKYLPADNTNVDANK